MSFLKKFTGFLSANTKKSQDKEHDADAIRGIRSRLSFAVSELVSFIKTAGAAKIAACLLLAVSVAGATAIACVAGARSDASLADYGKTLSHEEGFYMQQYTYSLFEFDSLFLNNDPETELLTVAPPMEVVVNDAGVRSTFYSDDMTVAEFFEANVITLGEEDTMNVAYEDLLSACGEITINRVGYSMQSEIKYTDFKTTTYRVYFLAAINRVPENSSGRKGQTRLTYRCRYVDGVLTEKVLVNTVKLSNPVNAVNYIVYHPEWEPKGLDMSYVVDTAWYTSTAYSSQQANLSECTAMGYRTDYGIAAVSYKNPGAVSMGTWIYVSCPSLGFDYGYAFACDTSHSSNSSWIDLHFDTVAEARAWGRRDVKIYVLSGRPDFVDPPERFRK